jgi:hypothetical protein
MHKGGFLYGRTLCEPLSPHYTLKHFKNHIFE